MLFRIFVILLVLAGGYASFEISRFTLMIHTLRATQAPFAIQDKNPETSSLILVEFLDYGCGKCKPVHRIVKDFMDVQTNIKYIVRPLASQVEETSHLASIALAAGLQDKFWALHEAFIAHEGTIDERFIRETAGLYGIDYERLMEDSKSEKIQNILNDNREAILNYDIASVPFLLLGKTFLEGQNFQKTPTVADFIRLANEAS